MRQENNYEKFRGKKIKIPKVFLEYKPPQQKQKFREEYYIRHHYNRTLRWTIRGIVRWLRDLDCKVNGYVAEEDPFVSIFGVKS